MGGFLDRSLQVARIPPVDPINRSTLITTSMSIVRVKNKYQVVIPERVRALVGVHVGDTFDVKAERGKIVFTPKSLVVMDRELALGLEDVRIRARRSPIRLI